MHYHFPFALLVSVGLIINGIHSHKSTEHNRRSNSNGNVFNLLLGLYKLNPLKDSQVFKAFSDQLLMSRSDKGHAALHFESNESGKEQVKTNLNEIEKIIHATSTKLPKRFEKPEYDINDVSIEKFKADNVDIVLNDQILSKEEFQRTYKGIEDFSSILGHIGSNEIDNDIPVTKLLPINGSTIPKMFNQNEAIYEIIDSKGKSGNRIGTLIEVRNKTPDESPINKKYETIIPNQRVLDQNEGVFEFIDTKGKSSNRIGTLAEIRDKTPEESPMHEKLDRVPDVIVL